MGGELRRWSLRERVMSWVQPFILLRTKPYCDELDGGESSLRVLLGKDLVEDWKTPSHGLHSVTRAIQRSHGIPFSRVPAESPIQHIHLSHVHLWGNVR